MDQTLTDLSLARTRIVNDANILLTWGTIVSFQGLLLS
jgi:hypothetical protein